MDEGSHVGIATDACVCDFTRDHAAASAMIAGGSGDPVGADVTVVLLIVGTVAVATGGELAVHARLAASAKHASARTRMSYRTRSTAARAGRPLSPYAAC